MYILFLLPIDGHLGCFHLLAITDNAVTNISVRATSPSFRIIHRAHTDIPRRGTVGSYGNSMFSFFKGPPHRRLLGFLTGRRKYSGRWRQALTLKIYIWGSTEERWQGQEKLLASQRDKEAESVKVQKRSAERREVKSRRSNSERRVENS